VKAIRMVDEFSRQKNFLRHAGLWIMPVREPTTATRCCASYSSLEGAVNLLATEQTRRSRFPQGDVEPILDVLAPCSVVGVCFSLVGADQSAHTPVFRFAVSGRLNRAIEHLNFVLQKG